MILYCTLDISDQDQLIDIPCYVESDLGKEATVSKAFFFYFFFFFFFFFLNGGGTSDFG